MNLLSLLPLSKNTLEILLEIYAAHEDYLRNLEKKTKINPSLLHRTLKKMVAAKVIMLEKKGKEIYYSLSSEDHFFLELLLEHYHRDKALTSHQTLGTLLKLLRGNKDMLDKCQHVYLFGSFVDGNINPESDIDLLFVTKHRDIIIPWCREAAIILQREINPVIYTPSAYIRDLKRNEAFLNSVIKKVKNRIILK